MEEDHHMRGKPGKPSKPSSTTNAPKKSDLMSSAKVMADAAKSALAHDTEKIDKAKVAGAAADLLGAAKHYGKLEENNFGKYVGKAETYLNQYHSSHSATASHPAGSYQGGSPAGHGGSYDGEGKHGQSSGGGGGGYGEYVKLAQGFLNKKQDQGGEGGGGAGGSSGGGGAGAGDYIKLAQGLLNKKQDHGGEGDSGGGADYIKLAQGFLKKH